MRHVKDYRWQQSPGVGIRWFVIALLLAPAISVASYAVLRAMGRPLPPASITPGLEAGLFLAFFVAGLAEEIAW